MSTGRSSPEKVTMKTNPQTGSKLAVSIKENKCDESQSGSDADETADDSMKLEDQLTFHKLKELEAIFEEADEDGGGGLDMDEFRTAMRKAMGMHLTDHEMDIIFMKVDTNCDGTVDWDEYLSYMLLEYRGKENMNMNTKAKPLPKTLRKVPNMNMYQRHHDTIVGIIYLPILVKKTNTLYKAVDDNNGKYLTVTKDGIVNFWNTDLGHVRRHRVTHANSKYHRKIGVWVTTFVAIPNLNMIAVATTSCNICFYDLTANKFSLVLNIMGLEITATCMDYWVHPTMSHKAQLLWGDTRGNITGLVFDQCPTMCFLQPGLNKHFRSNVVLDDVLRGMFCGVKGYSLPNIHGELVVCIKYYHCLGTFLSCCRERNTALFQGDVERKKSIYFKVSKGVFAFDYCRYNNVLVTGGKDAIVRVWNPYVQSKPVMILQGHKSPIFFVMVNSTHEQIVSISEDREINIFDMNTQTCVQTIFRKWVPVGPRQISAACFNVGRQALVIGNNNLAIFEHREKEIKTQKMTSHSTAVTKVLYNSLFNQIVSGGTDSMVHVWDASSGERIIQFNAHTKRAKGGEEIAVEITGMKFDPTLRRLITAARDGNVSVWNFNNGALLRQLNVLEPKEITSILVARQRIFTAGWNKKISVYMDSNEDDKILQWRQVHREDILAMALLAPATIASASYDGDIIIWSMEARSPMKLFNANESVNPLLIFSRKSRQKKETEKSKSASQNRQTEGSETCKNAPNKSILKSASVTCHSEQSEPDSEDDTSRGSRPANDTSVEALMFLERRETNKTCANLVAAGAGGWVRFWSIHPDGGLIGQFNAAQFAGGSILSIVTDEENQYLITGCSSGYVKVWDIANYCIEPYEGMDKNQAERDLKHKGRFVYLRVEECSRIWRERNDKFSRPPPASEPELTLKAPKILNGFRGHTQGITCIDFIDSQERIVTCSADCSVRVWTIEGHFIGICGREVPWSIDTSHSTYKTRSKEVKDQIEKDPLQVGRDKFQKARKISSRIPADVRSVASATTMRVLWGGVRPHWKLAKNIMTIWIPLFKLFQKNQPFRFQDQEPELTDNDSSPAAEEEMPLTLPALPQNSGDSELLGKSFKTHRKHQRMPHAPKIRQFNTLCDVYSSLPFYNLTPLNPESLRPPQSLVELKERNRKMIANSNLQLAQKTPAQLSNRKTRTSYKLGQKSKDPSHKQSFVKPVMCNKNSNAEFGL